MAGFDISANVTIKALAFDSKNQASDAANTYTFTEPEQGLKVYMNNTANWNAVNVHYWNEIPDVLPASSWPGPNMNDEGDGWFSYTFEGVTSTMKFQKAFTLYRQ
ncbi:MAG: starch-binding protein [Salinivirgaceae bacterium]|nr:starch-binding protein [Salinivirgaceae bacterium]